MSTAAFGGIDAWLAGSDVASTWKWWALTPFFCSTPMSVAFWVRAGPPNAPSIRFGSNAAIIVVTTLDGTLWNVVPSVASHALSPMVTIFAPPLTVIDRAGVGLVTTVA